MKRLRNVKFVENIKLKENKPKHIVVEKKSSSLVTTLVVLTIIALLMLITGL